MFRLFCRVTHADRQRYRWEVYNITTNQLAILQATRAMIDSLGNFEPSLDIYPDYEVPIVRNTSAGREAAMVRWGLPTSKHALYQAAAKRPTYAARKARRSISTNY